MLLVSVVLCQFVSVKKNNYFDYRFLKCRSAGTIFIKFKAFLKDQNSPPCFVGMIKSTKIL